MAVKSLSIQEARTAIEGGAQVIDVRLPFEYAGGRIPFSLNLPNRSIQTRKQLVSAEKPVLFLSEDGEQAEGVAAFAEKLGFPDVGFIAGGYTAWSEAGFPTETISEGMGGLPPATPPADAPAPAKS